MEGPGRNCAEPDGQAEVEGRAFARGGFDVDAAAEFGDHMPDGGEAEAGALPDLLGGMKRLEDAFDYGWRHAAPVVAHRQADPLGGRLMFARGASIHPFGGGSLVSSTKPRKLLLAEDEEPVSRIVTALLRRDGHTVVLATDGHNAWLQLSAAPAEFDAVIMDLNMPGLSGLELARRARALPYDRPLVVMSGRVTEDERMELSRLRIDAIINKPFTIEMLRTMLDSVLADPLPPGA